MDPWQKRGARVDKPVSDRFKLERTPNRRLLLVVVLRKDVDLSGSSQFFTEGRPRQT